MRPGLPDSSGAGGSPPLSPGPRPQPPPSPPDPSPEAATLLFRGLRSDHSLRIPTATGIVSPPPSSTPLPPELPNGALPEERTGKVPSGSQHQIIETAAGGFRSALHPPSPHISHVQVTGHFLNDGQSGGQGRSVFSSSLSPSPSPECGPYKREGVRVGLSVLRTQQLRGNFTLSPTPLERRLQGGEGAHR